MAFKRKETATPINTKAYKFRVFPEYQKPDFPDEIKEGIFREARLMGELWNRLVEIRKNILERYGIIYAEELANAEVEKLSAKELRKISPEFKSRTEELWKDYEKEIKTVADEPELRSKVSWEIREDVINRFETSHKRALKEGGEIKFQSGFIQQFHFPHRFTGGGLDVKQLYTKRSKKIFIEAVPEEFYGDEKYQNRKNRVVSGDYYRITGSGVSNLEKWRGQFRFQTEYNRIANLAPHSRGREFEKLITEIIKFAGWEAEHDVQTSFEQMDVVIHKKREFYLIECKWEKKPVESKVVNELFGKLSKRTLTNGILFSMSGFSAGADKNVESLTATKAILLFGENDLKKLIVNPAVFEDLLNEKFKALISQRKVIFE